MDTNFSVRENEKGKSLYISIDGITKETPREKVIDKVKEIYDREITPSPSIESR